MKRHQKICFSRKKNVGKANLGRNENHCHPQDDQIKVSQEKKDAVWLQASELYLNVYAHRFSGNHSKEIRNFKYNIVTWYLCAILSSITLITTCTAIVSL